MIEEARNDTRILECYNLNIGDVEMADLVACSQKQETHAFPCEQISKEKRVHSCITKLYHSGQLMVSDGSVARP